MRTVQNTRLPRPSHGTGKKRSFGRMDPRPLRCEGRIDNISALMHQLNAALIAAPQPYIAVIKSPTPPRILCAGLGLSPKCCPPVTTVNTPATTPVRVLKGPARPTPAERETESAITEGPTTITPCFEQPFIKTARSRPLESKVCRAPITLHPICLQMPTSLVGEDTTQLPHPTRVRITRECVLPQVWEAFNLRFLTP